MQVLVHILLVIVQLAVLLTLSAFVVGLIRKVKARLQCRRGASLFQPYADLAKLFRKQPVISSTARPKSWRCWPSYVKIARIQISSVLIQSPLPLIQQVFVTCSMDGHGFVHMPSSAPRSYVDVLRVISRL